MNQAFNLILLKESLLDWLRKEVVKPGIPDKTLGALIHHMADLGLLESWHGTAWKLVLDETSGVSDWDRQLREALVRLCLQEEGFALKFFLKNPPDNPPPSLFEIEPREESGPLSEGLVDSQGQLLVDSTSNLSNLQIVKKTGRQLSPFLNLEKKCLDQLQGAHTTRQEARLLFNYIISQMKEKGTPRPWEQLSRRRHR